MHAPTPDLDVELREHAVLLRLSRPQRRNALTVQLVTALADAIEDASSTDAYAVIITGAPPVFCAGGDLPELAGIAERGALAVSDTIYANFHRLVSAIAGSPLPVVAAVNGAAIGAGLDLALACDFRIAVEGAIFTSSWVTVGLIPGMGGAHFLPRLVGGTRAAEALLLGRTIDAETACGWGLVNDVTSPDDLLARCDDLARELSFLPRAAVARTKAALRRSLDDGLASELVTLGATQGALLTSEDFRTAVARFSTRGR